MSTPVENISAYQEPNFGLAGVDLMYAAEKQHHDRLTKLEELQQSLNTKLTHIKTHAEKSHKFLKKDTEDPLDFEATKTTILNLWNEWREYLEKKDPEEYKNLTNDLNKLDFSNLTKENIDDVLLPELDKMRNYFEFKYQKIPNELRLHMELFTIMVEILKEFPKKFAEVNSHTNRNIARG
jgi:hypothetical protein